jgi:hypothetical protein
MESMNIIVNFIYRVACSVKHRVELHYGTKDFIKSVEAQYNQFTK